MRLKLEGFFSDIFIKKMQENAFILCKSLTEVEKKIILGQ